MLLQENTLYDIDLGLNVTQYVTQYSLHLVTDAPARVEVAAFIQ